MGEQTRAAATRKAILSFALRHQKPGSGSVPWQRGKPFVQAWPNLDNLLRGIRWAIVGAVATRKYMPERATLYLDIAILAGDSDKVHERLLSGGYKSLTRLSLTYGSAWEAPTGQNLD